MQTQVLIIGAGMAGATCGRLLDDRGIECLVVEKSRGWGGRAASRRDGDVTFDHGAQFFTARDPEFADWTRQQAAAGTVHPWGDPSSLRWVGSPTMSNVVKAQGKGVEALFQAKVTRVTNQNGWKTELADQTVIRSTYLVVTAPSPQAVALLGAHSMTERLRQIEYAPAWSVMLTFDAPQPIPEHQQRTTDVIGWVAHNGSKHGRDQSTWVVHSTPEWAAQHLEMEPESVGEQMVEALTRHFKLVDKPLSVAAHRWRYARVTRSAGQPCIQDAQTGLIYAGDGCLGPRLEAAYLSGRAAADSILEWHER